MLPRLIYLVLSLPFFCWLSSCSTFDPPTVVPAYGHIDSIHFYITNVDTQGTASVNIPAAWVYVDDNPVGAFQLPCTFPIIAGNGNHSVKIYPAISAVDASSAYNINPFYQYYAISANLQAGQTTIFKPQSTYYPWVVYKLMENFEPELVNNLPDHIINFGGNGNKKAASTTTMSVISSPAADVFEGHHSGRVVVNTAHNYYIGMTDPALLLPHNGSTPVYLEANYKCTTSLSIGMFEEDSIIQISPAIVSATSTWKKVYVDLNTSIQAYQIYPDYRVWFSMVLDTADKHSTDTLLLDNIKIIY